MTMLITLSWRFLLILVSKGARRLSWAVVSNLAAELLREQMSSSKSLVPDDQKGETDEQP